MPAAIPFFGLGVYNLELPGVGTIPLDPWALLVCLGFVVGLEISRHRAVRLGLDVRDVVDGAVFTVLMGFVIGHVYTVVFYFPERLTEEGIWAILKVWTGFSSVGGFFGAVIGSVLFYRVIRPRNYLRFADVISFGFPFGWFFGRLGCGVVHDHIGTQTSMPWGMDFDNGMMNFQWVDGDPFPWAAGIRHELGLYEAAFMVPIMVLWLVLGRRDRVPGFFTVLFFTLYAPIRFLLDFLRVDDATYLGLTPAQYGLALIFVVGVIVLIKLPYQRFQPWPLDGEPDQSARAVTGEPYVAPGAAGEHGVDGAESESGAPAVDDSSDDDGPASPGAEPDSATPKVADAAASSSTISEDAPEQAGATPSTEAPDRAVSPPKSDGGTP